MSRPSKISKKQLLKVIDELERAPHDRVRILGEVGISTLGIGLGAAAAGTVASIAGATSIPVLTAAAGWVGVTAVAATISATTTIADITSVRRRGFRRGTAGAEAS